MATIPGICGIIAEYNPFHNGHLYHIRQAAKKTGAEAIIVAMGGNFVQRGEPALTHKFSRAAAALNGGADMVLELPLPYATASAEAFALGGCRLLAATNMVDKLCFGSESGDITPLYRLAHSLCQEGTNFKRLLKEGLAKGLSFPAARSLALQAESPDIANVISSPNNILGVEYIKAIIKDGLAMQAVTVKRWGAAHDAKDFLQNTASASAIRRHVKQDKEFEQLAALMPVDSYNILKQEKDQGTINHIETLAPLFHYAFQNTSEQQFFDIYNWSKELHGRITRAANANYSINDIVLAAKAKNNTFTGLQRAILQIVLQIPAALRYAPIPYIRVLGFKRSRQDLVHKLHKTSALPVLMNLTRTEHLDDFGKDMLKLELSATRTYWLGLRPQGVAERNEYTQPLVVV